MFFVKNLFILTREQDAKIFGRKVKNWAGRSKSSAGLLQRGVAKEELSLE